MSLGEFFDAELVRDLAGPRVHARGVAYHREGRVEPVALAHRRVQARVRGTVPYRVELWVEDGDAGWSCTCPAAEDGAFCKHCVAVALCCADGSAGDDVDGGEEDGGEEDDGQPPRRRLHAVPDLPDLPEDPGAPADLAGYVASLDRDRLVALVLEAVAADWRLRERLDAEARAARGDGADLASWRDEIDAAFDPHGGGFVDYRAAAGWARDVGGLIDALGELCDAGHAEAAAQLAEHAHRRAADATGYVDDSDGWLTAISERLAELHLRACSAAPPDPADLARRLVDLELGSDLTGFGAAALAYAELLGPGGLAEYRRLLERRRHDDRAAGRFGVRQALRAVAEARGDPDELVAVVQSDDGDPVWEDDHVAVVRALEAAGRVDEAVGWAQRALEAPGTGGPLRDHLARLLRARGEARAAVELYWEAFEAAPSLHAYRRVLEEADDGTAPWRHRCLVALRERLSEPPGGPVHPRFGGPRPADALVEILAYEGDVDAAWELAEVHGCDDRLWSSLAAAREATHPLDAIAVYERQALALIDRKRSHAYRDAVDRLRRIGRLAEAAGRPERFHELVTRIRAEHRAKRSLMRLLATAGW